MATFSAVNGGPPSKPHTPHREQDDQLYYTPEFAERRAEAQSRSSNADESSPRTPTRHSFGGVLGQRPLPNEPPCAVHDLLEHVTPAKRDDLPSKRIESSQQEPHDVEMGDGDDEENEDDGSDNDSITSDSQRPSKKKKGQRFFCTDFPPCQLSFTRSEHLARHIRKHTGERPFQCHCSRRFSRLDNLRQHAQTVHVNEEIPGDSLAATSTRFQRQIRTDRVRPPASRSRASTLGSQSGHARGHSRNLSTSSIGSTTSSMGTPEDARRRPQPLAMANDGNARAILSSPDAYSGGPGSPPPYMYHHQPLSGLSTPTSTTFSTGGHSPGSHSLMTSPSSSLGRSSYYNGARAGNRRLSVPSANNPFQSQSSYIPPPPFFSSLHSSQSSNFSQNSSTYGSPTSSVFSHGRRDSDVDMEYRRRTWHPSTGSQYSQRPATSGLTYHQTPDEPRPAFTQHQAASQMTRLPGIESFDHVPPPALRQHPSPMMMDSLPRPPSSGRPVDPVLHQGLTRLDITAANAPAEPQWQGYQQPSHQPSCQGLPATQYGHQKHFSMPEQPVTPRRNKREGFYGAPQVPIFPGPPNALLPHRPSPEDSGSSDGAPTPSMSQGPEYNPIIVNPAGPSEALPPSHVVTDESKISRADSGYHNYAHPPGQPPQTYALQAGHEGRFGPSNYGQPSNGMAKLEALVAVATSEEHRS